MFELFISVFINFSRVLIISSRSYSKSFRKSLIAALGGVIIIPILLVREMMFKKLDLPEITQDPHTLLLCSFSELVAQDGDGVHVLEHLMGLCSNWLCHCG